MSDDVSRETRPPLPPVAEGVFALCLDQARAFHDLLAGTGVERGVIGPRETDRLWERHLANCGVVADAVPAGSTVADVGSGAGLPGVVWAILRPDLQVTLVEPLLRRTTFLAEAVERLGLANVTVLRSRAEDVRDSDGFDVVTSRAVAPLGRLTRWCLPLLAPDGVMMALKGSSAQSEIERDRAEMRRLGARSVVVEEYGAHWLSTPTRVVVVRRRQG